MLCRKFLFRYPFPNNSHELGVEVVDPKKQLRVTSLGVVVAFRPEENPYNRTPSQNLYVPMNAHRRIEKVEVSRLDGVPTVRPVTLLVCDIESIERRVQISNKELVDGWQSSSIIRNRVRK